MFGSVIFLCTCSFGIRCNAILPGFIKTPMTDKVPDSIKEQVGIVIVYALDYTAAYVVMLDSMQYYFVLDS